MCDQNPHLDDETIECPVCGEEVLVPIGLTGNESNVGVTPPCGHSIRFEVANDGEIEGYETIDSEDVGDDELRSNGDL